MRVCFLLLSGQGQSGHRPEPLDVDRPFHCFCGLSMFLLLKSIRVLPLSTAYPVWTGIGAVGTVLLGILLFHEPASFWKVFFTATLILSIIGLKTVAA